MTSGTSVNPIFNSERCHAKPSANTCSRWGRQHPDCVWELVAVHTLIFNGTTAKEAGWLYFKRPIKAS